MTMTHPDGHLPASAAEPVPASLEVRDYLPPRCFPATRDDLQATLVDRHAPTRLLWALACVSPSRRFDDLDQLCSALEQGLRPSLPLEPI